MDTDVDYDSMDRLVTYQRGIIASGGGSITTAITLPGTDNTRTYNLDGLGNWNTAVYTPEGGSSTTETRTHNKLNEVLAYGVLPASTPVLYDTGNNAGGSYPTRGNGNIADDGTRTYQYDALNRLTNVSRKSDGLLIAVYGYDALGRRVAKRILRGGLSGTIANATHRYAFDGQQIIEEQESSATLRQFVWGQYIDELVQLNIPATTTTPPLTAGTYYPLQDTLYRTTALTDSTGAIKEACDYDAYGNTLMYNGPGTDGVWFTDDDVTTLQPMCEYLFTGRQYDPETEIYWYRARYYSPELGRFLGRDPIGTVHDSTKLLKSDRDDEVIPQIGRWHLRKTSNESLNEALLVDIRGILEHESLYEYGSGFPILVTDPLGMYCCGARFDNKLNAIFKDVMAQWMALSSSSKWWLSFRTVYNGGNFWDIDSLLTQSGGNAPCGNGSGSCVGSVTVGGKCHKQDAVNYYLGGLIAAMIGGYDSTFFNQYKSSASAYLLVKFATLNGTTDATPVEKAAWFNVGMTSGSFSKPAPSVYTEVCTPCSTDQKTTSWRWGWLGRASI